MPSEKDTRRQPHSAQEEEADLLHAEMERLVRRLAEVEPGDVCTVPLALDTDVARLMIERARLWDVPLSSVYHSAILHGLLHSALEDGERAEAQHIAHVIHRLSDEPTWQRFIEQHPPGACAMTDTQGLPERWVNLHPDARPVLDAIIEGMALDFLDHPRRYGLLLAPDRQSYILRVGVLRGTGLLTRDQAAALVRGMGITARTPTEAEAGDDPD